MAVGLGAAAGHVQSAPMVAVANTPRNAKKGLFGGVQLMSLNRWSYGGPGTTMAQQQRASKKRRNQARQKAARRR